MPRKSKLRGGVKYDTFDQYNEAILSFIENEHSHFMTALSNTPVDVNYLIQRIKNAEDFIRDAVNDEGNKDFWLAEQFLYNIELLMDEMISAVEAMKPGARQAISLDRITKEHYKFKNRLERDSHLGANIGNKTRDLEHKFMFGPREQHDRTTDKNADGIDRNEYTFWTKTSTKPGMERVELITYVVTSRDGTPVDEVPHRITIICTPEGLVYYNSTGQTIRDLPEDLQDYIRAKCPPILDENPVRHQWGSPVCERHSLVRICNAHLSNRQYHEFLTIEAMKRGFSYDELVWILTENAIYHGQSLELTGTGKCKKCGKNKKLPGSVLMYKYYM